MATASSATIARATSSRGLRTALWHALPPIAVVAGVAAALRIAYGPWYLNYDARYALLWARDVWHGATPDFTGGFAPTPHPLSTALSSLALPFGDASDQAIVWLVLLSFGALVWLVYRLGAELFSPWVGGVAALVVLTRPALQRDALLAYQDIPFAALVFGAVLLEARRPRRGAAVLVVLALAGLLRPEAWALAGLYFLYLWPAVENRERLRLAALVAIAPVLWALVDLIVTGDPLHSLHGTAALAEEVGRRRSPGQVPFWTLKYFGFTLREPVVIGIPIGGVFAWTHRRRRPAALPIAVACAMTAVFAIGPLFGLPLIGRYVRTPAELLTVFYGLAVCGWMLLPPGRQRRRWLVTGVLALGLSVVFLPQQVSMMEGLRHRTQLDGALYGDLREAAKAPEVHAAFASCAPLSVADHRPIPYVRYWLDGAPGSVGTVESGSSPLGRMLLVPRRSRLAKRFYKVNFPKVEPPPAYRVLYSNRSWRVYAAPGC